MNGISKIFIDTNILIYFLDKNKDFFKESEAFFNFCIKNKIQIGLSSLSITEYLIGIYREGKNDFLFFEFLNEIGIEICDLDTESAKKSARLRSLFNEKTPDLIHIGCALENGYKYFLSNDKKLKKIIDISVVNLEEFLT